MRPIFCALILVLCTRAFAGQSDFINEKKGVNVTAQLQLSGVDPMMLDSLLEEGKENPRLMSIVLCIALGPFGGHRLYLGTKPLVPVVYTLTLGGGLGVLPFIDLMQLIFTKDLERLRNNGNMFMWRPDPSTPQ